MINSAGQDNHYSDPLTRMNFTAQGYAKLTDRLAPDIAVLEGGYSIEGALPYVNLGIVAALAGLDYSGIHEPDYDPVRLRQSPILTHKIERIGDQVLEAWNSREERRKALVEGEDFISKPKQIYYDTDGILEQQVVLFKVCDHCPGFSVTQSANDRGDEILALHVPRKACDACRREALAMYEKAGPGFTNIYLQDRPTDRFLRK